MPTDARVLGADDALGEDEIDYVQQDCASLDEDIGREPKADVVLLR